MLTLRKPISFLISFCLIFEQAAFTQVTQSIDLSAHFANFGRSIAQSDKFRPLHLRSISYDSQSQDFQLLLDKGDTKFDNYVANELTSSGANELNKATQELFKYFFIGLTLPNDKFWVNLRPDSPDNILDPDLERTDVGRIFLEADLQLKKDTASFTSPQTPEGREYWDKLYKKAGELFGSENITIPTLTRPWIVPNEIIIRESTNDAYIYKATLKVMLEEDYLKSSQPSAISSQQYNFKDPRLKELNEYSTQLIRETIIPKLTYEVNTSKRYAPLRQVYYSLILAQWFKARFRLQKTENREPKAEQANNYLSLIDSGNLTNLTSQEPYDKQTYFRQYQKSFKDGEYNLSEPVYTPSGQSIRRYMSGGISRIAPEIPSLGSSSITDPKTGTKTTLVPTLKNKIITYLFTFLITAGDFFGLPPVKNSHEVQAQEVMPVSPAEDISNIDLITQVDKSGERCFFIPEESIENNIETIVKLFLNIINGRYNLNKFNSKRLTNTDAISHFTSLALRYPSIIREIIIQRGIPILLQSMEKGETYFPLSFVIIGILQHQELQKSDRELILETLLRDEYLKSDKAKVVFKILDYGIGEEIAHLIIAKKGLLKLIELAKDNDYNYFIKALNLLGEIVTLSPNNLPEQDSERIVLLIQNLLYTEYFFEAHGMLQRIIGAQPRYRYILKQISDKRERVNVLPTYRASEEIVLIALDHYEEDGHGFGVISQVLSELEGTPVDLNNEQFLDKRGKELGFGQPKENVGKIAKALFHKHGISLRMVEAGGDRKDIGEKELIGTVKENQDKTIIVVVALANYRFGFARLTDPSRINGVIDPSINSLGAKEILFILGAGNDGLPRIYTHSFFDNVAVVGATELYGADLYRIAPYSSYGYDLTFVTVPDKEGTSFSAPQVAGRIADLLRRNLKMSVKEALGSLKKEALPMPDELFRAGLLGHGLIKSQIEQDKDDRPNKTKSSTHSPLIFQKDFGGIDFTHLPIVTQAIANLGSSPLRPSSYLSLRQLNLSQERQAIERLASSGISPHPERLMSFLQASCLQDRIGEEKDMALGLLASVLRDEESSLRPTAPGLMDILVALESITSPQQLKEIFLGK